MGGKDAANRQNEEQVTYDRSGYARGSFILVRHLRPTVRRDCPPSCWTVDGSGEEHQILAAATSKLHPERVISSFEPKAVLTAKYLALASKIPYEQDARINEVDRDKAGWIENYRQYAEGYLANGQGHPQWEPRQLVERRIGSFIAEQNLRLHKTILIGHGMWLALLLSRLRRQPAIEVWESLPFGAIEAVDPDALFDVWTKI
jgi:hypothetical protein